jgi:hypothetical protein
MGEYSPEFLNTLVNIQERYFRVVEHSEGKGSTRSDFSKCKEFIEPTHSEVLEKLKET